MAGRLAQGLGAALMSPNVLSIIGVLYTGAQRIRAISVYGMVMGLAAVSGQLLGGLLIDANLAGWGWRTVFWVNLPIGAAALAAVRLIPESRAGRNRLDLGGVVLITAALLPVLLPLIQGRFGRRVVLTGAVAAAAGDLLLLLAVIRAGTGGPVDWLFPGLFLVGAGQGLCITPLTTTVLSHASPQAAGSVSGALSTVQQVGNAVAWR